MGDKDSENVELVDKLEKREAGVKELYEFYVGVETIYASSIKALEEEQTTSNANSANYR
jgi:hypothetical protein